MTDDLRPGDEAELAALLRETGPVRIRGGGTRPLGAPVAGRALDLSRLSGVVLHDPGALTLVARAGTPMAEIEAALAREHQRLPFEPMDHRGLLGTVGEPTIGGAVAVNASGPRRLQAGACRDSLIGVRFVDGTGTVIKNGGRVMKNVTGYDLVKLLAGSHGTLGVLTEVAFKLLPEPEAQATLRIEGLDSAQAVSVMGRAMGAPLDVSGAAYVAGAVLLRLEGLANSVRYRAGRLAALLGDAGAAEVIDNRDHGRVLWAGVRDVALFHGTPGDVWRLSVKPSNAPGLLSRLPGEAMLDWAGGLIWARVEEGLDLRAVLGPFAGHATLIRGTQSRKRLPVFHPEAAPLAILAQGLRRKFDPRGILNPGLMDGPTPRADADLLHA